MTNYFFQNVNRLTQMVNEDDYENVANIATIAHNLIFYRKQSILGSK